MQLCQREFDKQCPVPAEARLWVRMRQDLQRRGELPQGEAQVWLPGLEPYIDDLTGEALLDEVSVPDYLRHIEIGEAQTHAIGCRPVQCDSRLAVQCRIAVMHLSSLG